MWCAFVGVIFLSFWLSVLALFLCLASSPWTALVVFFRVSFLIVVVALGSLLMACGSLMLAIDGGKTPFLAHECKYHN